MSSILLFSKIIEIEDRFLRFLKGENKEVVALSPIEFPQNFSEILERLIRLDKGDNRTYPPTGPISLS